MAFIYFYWQVDRLSRNIAIAISFVESRAKCTLDTIQMLKYLHIATIHVFYFQYQIWKLQADKINRVTLWTTLKTINLRSFCKSNSLVAIVEDGMEMTHENITQDPV